MGSLLEKFISKNRKPILRETTLSDDDLVYLYQRFESLYLIRDDYLYRIIEKFSKIDSSNPRVSLKCVSGLTKPILELFQPYKELRKP
jgi:hypothetical protein